MDNNVMKKRLLLRLRHNQNRLVEENDLDIDEGTHSLCAACMLPVFSTLYEIDEAGRRRHRSCAKLKKVLLDHPLHMDRPLHLHHQSLLPHPVIANCDICGSACNDIFYQCSNIFCRYTLDVICAGTIVKILHRSHKHELLFTRSKTISADSCAACESKVEGDFYWCHFCDFYIHRSCASLPNAILHKNHHQHAMTLIYYLQPEFLKSHQCDTCSLCQEQLSTKTGAYICMKCNYATHIKCAISERDSFEPVPIRDIVDGLIHLPMPNEHTSVIQYLLENNSTTTEEESKEATERLHDHPLTFHIDYGEGSSWPSSNLCNACIQPISPPFYSCPQCNDFCLHNSCANLPLHINQRSQVYDRYLHRCKDKSLALHSRLSNEFFGGFDCNGCNLCSNGFVVKCETCSLKLDVVCALLPKAISHNAHGKSHILLRSRGSQRGSYDCCKSKFSYVVREFSYVYTCGSCPNFKVHARCALLPLSVEHKFDRHPLMLTTSGISTSKEDENFCEICEKDIYTGDWFYQCEECVTLFHIKCIPCVAEFSKIKFGGTVKVKCHSCPLTAIRLLTSYRYTCSLCKEIIYGGRVDSIAFECIKCCFWLHYGCARKEWDRD